MKLKFTGMTIHYIIRQMEKDRKAKDASEERAWHNGMSSGCGHSTAGPVLDTTDEEVRMVLDAHRRRPEEVL